MTEDLQHDPSDRPLAVFDLDGTLLRRDTFLPFLLHFGRRYGRWRALCAAPLWVGGYAARLMTAHVAKQRLLVGFLKGVSQATLDEHTRWFCSAWVSRNLNPALVERLREHQRAGHRVVLLSASPSVYVPAIARSLDIDEVVCTRVRFDAGRCLGEIEGENCKGPAKLRALQAFLGNGEAPARSCAYGDSRHDQPVLRWVESGYLVSRRGIRLITPERTPRTPVIAG